MSGESKPYTAMTKGQKERFDREYERIFGKNKFKKKKNGIRKRSD